MKQVIKPENEAHWLELRKNDITSTEVSALFGVSPYQTFFEVWHRHKDKTIASTFEANDRMKWGTRLQNAIAAGIAEDQGWIIREMKEYVRNPDLRMGSSFDFAIEGLREQSVDDKRDHRGLLEIKNVDSLQFKNGWLVGEDGTVEAPPHIELQLQHQLRLTNRSYGYIGALVGGNNVQLLRREADKEIGDEIEKRIADFWKSIDENRAPEPDFTKDADFIAHLHSYAEPGKHLDATNNWEIQALAETYRTAGQQEKQASEAKQAAKAKILTLIQDCEKVLGNGFSISAGMVGPASVAYEREAYRNFRINWKKVKS